MAHSATQRRDQRRRLVLSWRRSAGTAGPVTNEPTRGVAGYEPEAHPNRQKGPAVLVPTGLGGLSLAIIAILLPVGGATIAGASEMLFGQRLFVGGGRFTRTLALLGDLVDARGSATLQVWLAEVYLLLAAVVALVVRQMRRHRRDDYKGRFRAWGWMATLLVITACAGVMPLGRLVGMAMMEATGIAFGPDGLGWWTALASTLLVAVSLWAVLPLHERFATAVWLGLALAAWGASAASPWLGAADPRLRLAAVAAWPLAAACSLVAMLAAARSVIREIKGEGGAVRRERAVKATRASAREIVVPGEDEAPADDEAVESFAEESDDHQTEFVDGSDHGHRHLSKAERKRLKKLARMNGDAA